MQSNILNIRICTTLQSTNILLWSIHFSEIFFLLFLSLFRMLYFPKKSGCEIMILILWANNFSKLACIMMLRKLQNKKFTTKSFILYFPVEEEQKNDTSHTTYIIMAGKGAQMVDKDLINYTYKYIKLNIEIAQPKLAIA